MELENGVNFGFDTLVLILDYFDVPVVENGLVHDILARLIQHFIEIDYLVGFLQIVDFKPPNGF